MVQVGSRELCVFSVTLKGRKTRRAVRAHAWGYRNRQCGAAVVLAMPPNARRCCLLRTAIPPHYSTVMQFSTHIIAPATPPPPPITPAGGAAALAAGGGAHLRPCGAAGGAGGRLFGEGRVFARAGVRARFNTVRCGTVRCGAVRCGAQHHETSSPRASCTACPGWTTLPPVTPIVSLGTPHHLSPSLSTPSPPLNPSSPSGPQGGHLRTHEAGGRLALLRLRAQRGRVSGFVVWVVVVVGS